MTQLFITSSYFPKGYIIAITLRQLPLKGGGGKVNFRHFTLNLFKEHMPGMLLYISRGGILSRFSNFFVVMDTVYNKSLCL